MKPPPDLPLELVLLGEAFARRLEMQAGDFWAVLYRKKAAPPGWAAAWADAFSPLTLVSENDTLDTLDATQMTAARRGRPIGQPKHPFVVALLREGLTIAEVAAKLKRAPSTVKSWYKPEDDEGRRPIPRAVALELAKKPGTPGAAMPLGVPLSAWSRIAD